MSWIEHAQSVCAKLGKINNIRRVCNAFYMKHMLFQVGMSKKSKRQDTNFVSLPFFDWRRAALCGLDQQFDCSAFEVHVHRVALLDFP